MRHPVQCLGTIALLAAMLAFAGCSRPTAADGVRNNFSPELHSTARSYEQHQNIKARALDTNGRGFHDDATRALLLNQPTRLSPYPIP